MRQIRQLDEVRRPCQLTGRPTARTHRQPPPSSQTRRAMAAGASEGVVSWHPSSKRGVRRRAPCLTTRAWRAGLLPPPPTQLLTLVSHATSRMQEAQLLKLEVANAEKELYSVSPK